VALNQICVAVVHEHGFYSEPGIPKKDSLIFFHGCFWKFVKAIIFASLWQKGAGQT
jgi:G:T-mismatch repair DNA endonuclease (very short patch repair protein)